MRREVEVEAGAPLEILLPLSEGTGSYAEHVTVQAVPFEEREVSVPAQELLGSGEIQSLRGSLLDDPLRAVQTLPGVAAGDDFHALFSVRGSDFRHMGFSLDGIPTPFLLHTVQGVEGSGSVTMFNSELLESLSLLHGSYPRYGNRTGAQLDFVSREGSRGSAPRSRVAQRHQRLHRR